MSYWEGDAGYFAYTISWKIHFLRDSAIGCGVDVHYGSRVVR